MSSVRIYLHCVFATKKREPLLVKEKREIFFAHILENAKEKGIEIDTIGGFEDHVHVLIRLKATQTVAEVMKAIKGEASHWANQQQLFETSLNWARSYFAASAGEQSLPKLRNYIKTQESHHQKISFLEEYFYFTKEHYQEEEEKEQKKAAL
jgi:REP element-mobilizing transposase RayT